MPSDTAYVEASNAVRGRRTEARFVPVRSPGEVWATAQRAFRTERTGRLALRARVLDVLEYLDRGHLLAFLAGTCPAVSLNGHPDVTLVAGTLFTYRFVEIAGRHRENANIVYFGLSAVGARKLEQGRAWWSALSRWQRLQVRLFG